MALRVNLFMVLGEPKITPRREAATAFSSDLLQCFNNPSQPASNFSGVFLQRGCALLQKRNLAFCRSAEVRHANLAAFSASTFCPSFSQNFFRAQLAGDCRGKAICVAIYARLPED
jgi:hypothetical protein